MEYKLARADLTSETTKVTLEEIEEMVKPDGETIMYFDRENPEKALNQLVKHFDKQNKTVYLREVRYGLDESDYIYEVHIL